MTEIPEHLLRRSRERRAALSGEEEGAAATPTEAAQAVTAETPRAAAPVVAGTPTPETQAEGGALAPPPGTRTVSQEIPEPVRLLGPTRVRTPVWILPVLIALPLWGFVYMGAFGNRAKAANTPLSAGATLFTANCAVCHGSSGEGGVGPQLSNGAVLRQWPKLQDHLDWVRTGGATHIGQTIGGVVVTPGNAMPGFGSSLTAAQIADVVCFERVTFGGAPNNTQNCPATP